MRRRARGADDELRALGGCTTPEELDAARAAYERAHPGVFVRKEQGLLLRADVPFRGSGRPVRGGEFCARSRARSRGLLKTASAPRLRRLVEEEAT